MYMLYTCPHTTVPETRPHTATYYNYYSTIKNKTTAHKCVRNSIKQALVEVRSVVYGLFELQLSFSAVLFASLELSHQFFLRFNSAFFTL